MQQDDTRQRIASLPFSRRAVLRAGVALAAISSFASAPGFAETATSLQDLSGILEASPEVTIYTAKEIITLDPARPAATAVAVVAGRILAVGSLDEVKAVVGDQPTKVDSTFDSSVIVPGFVAQHDHPVLTALTLSAVVLSIEDWVLPTGTVKAVKDKQDFLTRLAEAEGKMDGEEDPLLTWGYHSSFYGNLTRAELDKISTKRPILVWGRSAHEMVLNTPALASAGVTQDVVNGWNKSQQEQSNFDEGHFWEQGMFAVGARAAGMIATPERLQAGLELARDYMHSKGITVGNEPGGIAVKALQDGVNAVFSTPSMPFRWYFMVDGKTMADKYKDDAQVIAESQALASWYVGMTSMAPNQSKLFADGAIYSQLMQVRDPYLDKHEGAWMTDLEVFQRAFRIYWDAGYQIHIHVNGDAGLDRVLNTLEANLRRNPRFDHRTTIVHFAVSAADQVQRIKALGAIVSGNPYYVTALADNYSEVGLGPERADQMVRMGDVERAGISYSFHSDMPMAPADPLFLMWCGVTRLTTSGRVAGDNQRVSREGALRAVTSEAAYSLKLENELGTITPGKKANFTILDDNPVTCDIAKLRDIKVWGTVMEGRRLPVGYASNRKASLENLDYPTGDRKQFALAMWDHVAKVTHLHGES